MDVFYEESAIARDSIKGARKYKILSVISGIFLALAIFWVMMFFWVPLNNVPALIFWGLMCAGYFGLWYLLRRWKQRFNVSYDYCFVSGELRISRVININKRKLVARFDSEDIIQIGDVENSSFERFRHDPTVKTVLCTSNDAPMEGKFFMYVLANYNGKKLFVLECREDLLINIMKFTKRTTLESDYVMQEKKARR